MTQYSFHWRRPYLLLIPCLVALAVIGKYNWSRIGGCSQFTDSDRERLIQVFKRKFSLGANSDVELQAGGTLAGSCLRKLNVHSAELKRDFSYLLSEDKHYLLIDAMNGYGANTGSSPRQTAGSVPSIPVNMAALTVDDQITYGPTTAPVTMVIFSDFQCPYCQKLAGALPEIKNKEAGNLHIVFRQYPLPMHPYAKEYAEIATCAGKQSNAAFWAAHDYFFGLTDRSHDASSGALKALRARSDIKVPELNACVEKHETDAEIDRDVALGQRYGVSGTPTMFINGTRVPGMKDTASLLQIIDSKRQPPSTTAQHGSTSTSGL